ncbi:hypothetical protein [Sphingomonas sp.]|uniref:hypothetical protein n=1 Tax=Sphingomonas sp. TaxID=28214 RepID=UPI003B00FCCA
MITGDRAVLKGNMEASTSASAWSPPWKAAGGSRGRGQDPSSGRRIVDHRPTVLSRHRDVARLAARFHRRGRRVLPVCFGLDDGHVTTSFGFAVVRGRG